MRNALVLAAALTALAIPARGACPDVDFAAFDMPPSFLGSEPPGQQFTVEAGYSGSVTLDVYVLESGRVCDVRAHEDYGRLGLHAVRETRRARFLPAERDGHFVPGVATVTFEYELPEIRRLPPVLDTASPMVSERAEVVGQSDWRCDGEIPTFKYDDVVFLGDISIRDYEMLLTLVQEHVDETRVVGRIHHFLVYPCETQDLPTYAGDRADVGIEVVRRSDKPELGGSSTIYHFVNDGGEYRLFPIVTKTTACFTVPSDDGN